MPQPLNPSRRNFCLSAICSVVLLPLLWACGKDSSSSTTTTGTAGCPNGTNTTISANHGHVMTVSAADVNAGVDKSYDITGTAGHAHTVTLTAADFTSIKAGNPVVKTSTSTGHTHDVTVICP